MKQPTVKWRQQRAPAYADLETWFARYRGWTLYAGRIAMGWRATLHRFRDGTADSPRCTELYPTLEGAQNAAEFYAESGRFPHARS